MGRYDSFRESPNGKRHPKDHPALRLYRSRHLAPKFLKQELPHFFDQ